MLLGRLQALHIPHEGRPAAGKCKQTSERTCSALLLRSAAARLGSCTTLFCFAAGLTLCLFDAVHRIFTYAFSVGPAGPSHVHLATLPARNQTRQRLQAVAVQEASPATQQRPAELLSSSPSSWKASMQEGKGFVQHEHCGWVVPGAFGIMLEAVTPFFCFCFCKMVQNAGIQQGTGYSDPRQRQLWSDIRAEAKLDAVGYNCFCMDVTERQPCRPSSCLHASANRKLHP